MAIQLFTPQFEVDECLQEIRQCLVSGWTGLGFKTLEIEKRWSDYAELPYSHFLNSNTAGLHLALNIFKRHDSWADGDEIISSPLTFVSTNHAIMYERLKPVFADVDETLCLSPESVLERITKKTRAVMFVGIGGNVGQYEKIREICRDRGLRLILDAAHMAGTRFKGRHVGHDADVAVFSFQAVKNLGTADAGMICFSDRQLDEEARKMSWLGINKDTYQRTSEEGSYKWRYEVEHVGFKYHGNSIMAAIALVQLKYLDRNNAYRARIAGWYKDRLAGQPHISFIPIPKECESSWHLCQIRVPQRDSLLVALNQQKIFPGVHYRDNTEYSVYSYAAGSCPNATTFSNEVVSLPLHMNLRHEDVQTISNVLITRPTISGNDV